MLVLFQDYRNKEVIQMDSMEKDFKNIFDESFLSSNEKNLKRSEVEYEIIEYNRKLHEITKTNRINLHNEVNFIMQIKKQISNKELLPLVFCFLCDKNYLKKFKNEKLNLIERGDISAYVLLKTNIEKFSDEIKYIQENKKLGNSYESENPELFNKLEALVAETYERCNSIYIRRNNEKHKISANNEEKYIQKIIYKNIKFKTINYKIYMKKLAYGMEAADEYLRDITKKFLKFNEDKFIKEVEHVNEFYIVLEKILNEEMNKEFESIISEFIYNAVLSQNEF